MTTCDREPTLLPMAEAIARMSTTITPVTATETQPLTQLLDRVLAQPVHAQLAVPGHDNAAMDGYALRAADGDAPRELVGQALAGHPFEGEIKPGQCVRITTGAMLPAGADTVIMQENTRTDAQQVWPIQTPRAGDNIRRAGEDIAPGSQVLPKGHRVGPVDVALLASVGIAKAWVYRRLKVAILSTGDELVAPGAPLAPGQLYDSNRFGIAAVLQRLNVQVIDLGLIADDPAAIHLALQRASEQADVVISSGGVSVGEADHVKDVLTDLGQINFWKVAIKPGKPFAFGTLGDAFFFGLPGNPVSAMVTLHQLAMPVLRTMAGEHIQNADTFQVKSASKYRKRPGRLDFQRATLSEQDGQCTVSRNGPQGSGVLTSFRGANCYVVLEQERGSIEEEEFVTVLPFDRFIR